MISTKRLKKKPLGARTITTYFKLSGSEYIFTGEVVLSFISDKDTYIHKVLPNGINCDKIAWCKPETYELGETYPLNLKSTFDILDRVNCNKTFLQHCTHRYNLTYVFAKTKNIQGLLWMYKKLQLYKRSTSGNKSDIMNTIYFIDDVWKYAESDLYAEFLRKINEIDQLLIQYENYE